MNLSLKTLLLTGALISLTLPSYAVGPHGSTKDGAEVELAPHKALYAIDLVASRSGSQIVNIKGQMFYEWKPTCEAWVTDHRFNLTYEYADNPSMTIMSDFSTYESYDGGKFNFNSSRKRDGKLYQELRGHALKTKEEAQVSFSKPDGLSFDLKEDYYFPMGHTIEMIRHAKAGKKFFQGSVFDGSDEEGPVSINSFIGKEVNAMTLVNPSADLDMSLINTPAWNVRMAVFPEHGDEAVSDYEMSLVFHDNGVISDMLIEYDDFSITQKLVALEKLDADGCDSDRRMNEE